jgi:hypothetical protein
VLEKLLRDSRTQRFPDEFPDGLLLEIVNCFEWQLFEFQFLFGDGWGCFPKSGLMTIKNIHLTCRGLCDISSHLLLPCIHVLPSFSSLEHLDEVLNHPTISQGLRVFVVDMANLRANSAQAFRLFSRHFYWRVGKMVSTAEES